MTLEQLTASIYNNVLSGLPGVTINTRFTLEQIEDSIISERQAIIKEYSLKNLIPKKDLLLSINCIEADCQDIDRCCTKDGDEETTKHIEIPQVVNDFGGDAIDYIGSVDRTVQFKVYTDQAWRNHQFKRRGAERPYVWIDTAPNKNNMYDAFIFNAPFVQKVTISAIFKDPRQLAQYICCSSEEINNINYIDTEIEKRVTEKYIRYYRQMAQSVVPNTQAIA